MTLICTLKYINTINGPATERDVRVLDFVDIIFLQPERKRSVIQG